MIGADFRPKQNKNNDPKVLSPNAWDALQNWTVCNRTRENLYRHLREKQAETAAAWQAQIELRRLDDEEQRITAQIDEAKSSLSHISNDRTHEEQSSSESTSMFENWTKKELQAQSIPKKKLPAWQMIGEKNSMFYDCGKLSIHFGKKPASKQHEQRWKIANYLRIKTV